MTKLLESLNLYTKLHQIIPRFIISCLRATAASGPSLWMSPKHTSPCSYKPLSFHLFLKGHRDSFTTRASISCYSKPAQIFGKVIGYGYEVPAWSQ